MLHLNVCRYTLPTGMKPTSIPPVVVTRRPSPNLLLPNQKNWKAFAIDAVGRTKPTFRFYQRYQCIQENLYNNDKIASICSPFYLIVHHLTLQTREKAMPMK